MPWNSFSTMPKRLRVWITDEMTGTGAEIGARVPVVTGEGNVTEIVPGVLTEIAGSEAEVKIGKSAALRKNAS